MSLRVIPKPLQHKKLSIEYALTVDRNRQILLNPVNPKMSMSVEFETEVTSCYVCEGYVGILSENSICPNCKTVYDIVEKGNEHFLRYKRGEVPKESRLDSVRNISHS